MIYVPGEFCLTEMYKAFTLYGVFLNWHCFDLKAQSFTASRQVSNDNNTYCILVFNIFSAQILFDNYQGSMLCLCTY